MQQPKSTYAEREKRFLHLNALYKQASTRTEFLECTNQCERSLLDDAGMSAYWRVKTYCILVGVHEDWKAAEVNNQ
jgi:hypothetical protein